MISFKEFFENVEQREISDFEVAHRYASNKSMKVKELASSTGRSVGEVYNIIRKYGMGPNRQINNHTNVISLAEDPYMTPQRISQLVGYTPRHIRNILNHHRMTENDNS